jgi:hypothetical protein
LRVFRIQPSGSTTRPKPRPFPFFGSLHETIRGFALHPDSATRPKSRPFAACRFADALAGLRFPDRFRKPRPKPSSLPRLAVALNHCWFRSPTPFQDRTEIPSLPAWRLPDPLAVFRSPASVPANSA